MINEVQNLHIDVCAIEHLIGLEYPGAKLMLAFYLASLCVDFYSAHSAEGTLTASSSRGYTGKLYAYYHCRNGCSERLQANQVNSDFVKLLESISANERVIDLYAGVIRDRELRFLKSLGEEAIKTLEKEVSRRKRYDKLYG